MKRNKLLMIFLFCSYYVFPAEIHLPDGSVYFGETKENLFNGHGTQKWSDGAFYEGNFTDGKYNGLGVLKNTIYTYEGEFKDGVPHGRGNISYKNGLSYEGEFLNGLYEGKGTLIDNFGNSITMKKVAMDLRNLQMVIHIEEVIKMVCITATVYTVVPMAMNISGHF